ncbi:MAG: hypothetical protein ACYDB4_14215 [Candidatus Dormibacteraceae bacterium]
MSRSAPVEINARLVSAKIKPRLSVADFIRDNATLTGTHLGWEQVPASEAG